MRTLLNSVLAMAPSYRRFAWVGSPAVSRTAGIELLQGRARFHWPLQGGPMAAARQDDETGARNALCHGPGTRRRADGVFLAGDQQGRAGDPRDIGGFRGGQGLAAPGI